MARHLTKERKLKLLQDWSKYIELKHVMLYKSVPPKSYPFLDATRQATKQRTIQILPRTELLRLRNFISGVDRLIRWNFIRERKISRGGKAENQLCF